MGGLIAIAVSGGATGIAVALLVWWLVSTVRGSERRASAAQIALAQRDTSDANQRAERAEIERARWEKMYAAQREAFLTHAKQFIHAASDDEVLHLAGGDPGPIADGLLEPDWNAAPVGSGDLPEPR